MHSVVYSLLFSEIKNAVFGGNENSLLESLDFIALGPFKQA